MCARHLSGTIEVRTVLMDGAGEEEYSALLRKLPHAEQAEAGRFLLLRDRLAFATGRVLVRAMLSRYAPEPAEGWCFVRSEYGKPSIVPTDGAGDLRFNLSHCAGLVVAAIAFGREVGVDVASLQEKTMEWLELAQSYFADTEIELLDSLHVEERMRTFLALWTLKEAYGKARGVGLSRSLREAAFGLDPPVLLSSAQGEEHFLQGRRWFFHQQQVTPVHVLAVAAQQEAGEEVVCHVERMGLRELL